MAILSHANSQKLFGVEYLLTNDQIVSETLVQIKATQSMGLRIRTLRLLFLLLDGLLAQMSVNGLHFFVDGSELIEAFGVSLFGRCSRVKK